MKLFIFALLISIISTVISVCICVATWQDRGRFIFLPGGDVGLGVLSHRGWLSWIEYAAWSKRNPDYVRWSVPWGLVIGIELVFIVWCAIIAYRYSSRSKQASSK